MVGFLIVAHDGLGDSLIHCASHVLGKRPQKLAQIGVSMNDDPDAVLPQARTLTQSLDDGGGVLILSDIFGGTPCNIACRLLIPGKVEGIAGVSLPMLIRVLTYRNEALATVVQKALSGGHEGVLQIQPDCRHATT